jgi:hypothetical protein
MLVKIRFGTSQTARTKRRQKQRIALGVSALLTPAAAMASVLGIWRIAADLNWAGQFAITSGFFSHWQVWLAAAALLQLGARILNRYAHSGEPATASKASDILV